MQFIPPFLCHLIDAVAYRDDPQRLQDEWLQWKEDFLAFFEAESEYTLNQDDAQVVQNIPPLLAQLETSANRAFEGQCQVDDLIKDAIDFFTAHDAFLAEREKQYFVANLSLDRLLKAAVAHLQGNAPVSAVHRRAPEAAHVVAEVNQLFLSCRDQLPNELIEGTLEGLGRAQDAFEKLAGFEAEIPPEALEAIVFELKASGLLLEHVPNLFRRFEEEAASPIPIAGPLLTWLKQRDTEEGFEELRNQAWPAFLDLWQGRQDGWMIDPEHLDELLGAADEEVAAITELMETYPDQEDDFWDSVERLEDLFDQVRANALATDELPSSPYWPEAQLLLNLLRGGAPMYAAQSLGQSIAAGGSEVPPTIKTVGESLLQFVRQPDPLPLLVALKELKTDFELSKTSRTCSKCGERIALEARACDKCGTAVEELSISG